MRGEVVATIGSARYYLANTLTTILAPDNAAHTFAAHDAVCGDFLCAYALVE